MNDRFDFDLDDPLADILSTNSNDSFYDDSNFVRKSSSKKNTFESVDERKNILFKLEQNTDTQKVNTEERNEELLKPLYNITEPSTSKTILQASQLESQLKELDLTKEIGSSKSQKPSQSLTYIPTKSEATEAVSKQDNALDFLDDLGLSDFEKKPLGKSSNITSELFNDILGDDIIKKSILISSPVKKNPNTVNKKTEIAILVTAKGHSTSADLKPNSQVITTLPRSDSPSRIKNVATDSITNKRVKSNIDWLGLGDTIERVEIEQAKDDDVGLPAWLMSKDTNKNKNAAQPKPEILTNIQERKTATPALKEDAATIEQQQNLKTAHSNVTQSVEQIFHPINAKISTISNLGLIDAGSNNLAQEGANMYIQEQESQLMVALQLKAQEEKLSLLQSRQQEQRRIQMEADRGHKSQLELMLSKQAEQRRLMQNIIMKNQDNVNRKIKALLGQTSSNNSPEQDETYEVMEGADADMATPKTINAKMTEKMQLMQLIVTLQENHDKEMELMENSYRRQLSFANSTVTDMEDRLKEDNDRLCKFHAEKTLWMEQQCKAYVQRADEQLALFAAHHQGELHRLQQQQTSIVEVLQQQHTKLLDNIRETLQQEQHVINDATSYSTTLSALKVDINANTGTCATILNDLHTSLMSHQQQSSAALTKKEELLSGLLESLNKEKELFFKEKSESVETSKLLESRLRQMTQTLEEENHNLKQRRMEFEFDKATFKKQTEYAKSLLEKQQEEMKMIREKMDAEYSQMQTKFDELRNQTENENSTLAMDKRNMESAKREIEKLKVDFNNQLEDISNEKTQLSSQKQKLHTDELTNIKRSNELELLTRQTLDKQMQADRKMSEADFIVKNYEERLRKIQEQVLSLNSREKQIARDKSSLSRERLSLYNERRELETRQQCSLCRASQNQSNQLTNHVYGEILDESYVVNRNDIIHLNTSVSRDGHAGNDVNTLEQQMEDFFVRQNVAPNVSEKTNIHYNNDVEKLVERKQYFGHTRPNDKEIIDPRLLMLKLDVQQVINNLSRSAETQPRDS